MISKHMDQNNIKNNHVDISIIRSYKDVFSSFQWIEAFLKIYDPKNIRCITCDHVSAYYYLDDNKIMVNVGDPFNDFNAICTCSRFARSIKDLCQEYSVFISNSLTFLNENKVSETECYKTCLENYGNRISNRVYKQYINTLKEVVYRQFPSNHPAFMRNVLWLLKYRQKHLVENKPEESNNSYHDKFNNFMIEFCSKSHHSETIRIEVLESVNSGEILAMNLNFYAPDGIMCYLRACARETSKTISYGLVLDLHIMLNAKNNKYQTYDLTRGGESYKLRLGAEKYIIYNQLIDNK